MSDFKESNKPKEPQRSDKVTVFDYMDESIKELSLEERLRLIKLKFENKQNTEKDAE
jgi:hypothetical protein